MKQPNKLQKQLSELMRFIDGDLGEFEADNLRSDIAEMTRRLKAGQYRETNFVARSGFDVPRRTSEFLLYLDGYWQQGERWAKILNQIGVGSYTKVVDICPGWAPKVEMGLHQLGYKGIAGLWDKDAKALVANRRLMKFVGAEFTIEEKVGDVLERKDFTNKTLYLANHVIDDFLYDFYAEKYHYDAEKIYLSEVEMVRVMEEILADRAYFENQFNRVIDWFGGILKVPGNGLVISHYRSVLETAYANEAWNHFTDQLYVNLEEEMTKVGERQSTSFEIQRGFTLGVWRNK